MQIYARRVESSTKQPRRRGYGQFCAAARALDVVGERWTLLVVRDLMAGPKRYTDLREGLPGIATDLLTARLRTLEGAGLVRRRSLPRPAPATVYELTERGWLLAPVVQGLARVGFAFLDEPADDEPVPPDRLVLALRASFRPDVAGDMDATYELHLGDETFVIAVRDGTLETARGTAPDADLVLRTDPVTLVRVLQDDVAADDAIATGKLRIDGDRSALGPFVAALGWERSHSPAGAS